MDIRHTAGQGAAIGGKISGKIGIGCGLLFGITALPAIFATVGVSLPVMLAASLVTLFMASAVGFFTGAFVGNLIGGLFGAAGGIFRDRKPDMGQHNRPHNTRSHKAEKFIPGVQRSHNSDIIPPAPDPTPQPLAPYHPSRSGHQQSEIG